VCELCERLCVSVCVQGVLRNYFVCKIMRIAYGEKSGKKARKKGAEKGERIFMHVAANGKVGKWSGMRASHCLASHFYCISTLEYARMQNFS